MPRADPAAWVLLSGSGKHPGRGVNQAASQGIDRYAITAYEVQAGDDGLVQITNGTLGVSSANSNGVELRVYVNDTLVTHFVQPGGSTGTGAGAFNVALSQLVAGDKGYVAVGPNAHDGSDSFSLTYGLETVADTASVFWGSGSSGTWDTSTAQWARGVHNPGPHVAWDNAANRAAYFTGTVTLGSPVTACALSFDAPYTLAGTESLTLTGTVNLAGEPEQPGILYLVINGTGHQPLRNTERLQRPDQGRRRDARSRRRQLLPWRHEDQRRHAAGRRLTSCRQSRNGPIRRNAGRQGDHRWTCVDPARRHLGHRQERRHAHVRKRPDAGRRRRLGLGVHRQHLGQLRPGRR